MEMEREMEFSCSGAREFAEKNGWTTSGIAVESSRGKVAIGMQRRMATAPSKGARPYYAAWRCASEMLADRGYDIDESSFDISYDRFLTRFCLEPEGVPPQSDLDRLSITASRSRSGDQDEERVLVLFFGPEVTVTIDTLRLIYSSNKDDGILPDRLTVIAHKTLLPLVHRQVIEAVCPFKVETFHVSQLSTNLVRCFFHKKFRVLTSEEKERLFLRPTEVKITSLPSTDWIYQYYSLEKGVILGALDPLLAPPADSRILAQRALFSGTASTQSFVLLAETGIGGVIGQAPEFQNVLFEQMLTKKSLLQRDLETEFGIAYPYYIAWMAVSDMLYYRGYTESYHWADPDKLDGIEFEDFLKEYRLPSSGPRCLHQSDLDRLEIIVSHKDSANDLVVVTFRGPRETVDLETVRQLYKRWRDERPKRLIVVMQKVQLSREDLFLIHHTCPLTVEFFHMNDICGNTGTFGDTYETMMAEEKRELFCKDFKFKYMTAKDDVTRYLGVEGGELLKCVRNFGHRFPLDGGKKKQKRGGPEYVVAYMG